MRSKRPNRIALIGQSRTGKTTLFNYLKSEEFSTAYRATNVADHFTFLDIPNGFPDLSELNFWDLSGDLSGCAEILEIYLAAIDIAVIVTDSLSTLSINQVDAWFGIVEKATMADPPPAFIVVRSKLDLASDDPFNFGETLRRIRHCDVMSLSARSGNGVEEFLSRLCEICLDRKLHPRPARPTPVKLDAKDEVFCGCK
jgi:ethanolamine utilization protein EutP (predicted NTPase)